MKTLNITGLKKKMMKKARKLKWSVLKRKECNDIRNKSLTQPVDNEGEKFDFLVNDILQKMHTSKTVHIRKSLKSVLEEAKWEMLRMSGININILEETNECLEDYVDYENIQFTTCRENNADYVEMS